MPLRFALALHDHQPVGNFDSVYAQAYADAYFPFLDIISQYPELAFSLHISGPLLDWLEKNRPDHLGDLKELVKAGQLEIIGGAYYEPILPILPRRDRVGQIRRYSEKLKDIFDTDVRGMWLAERVWEPSLVTDLLEADIEYTLLDDFHFKQAGMEEDDLHGYFLTEDQGFLLRIFPISEPLRYMIPWKDPAEAISYLDLLAETYPDSVVVCADDGEKFGSWPGTNGLCYEKKWLTQFFDLLLERQAQDKIQLVTLSQALDETPPQGTIYLPECSYREMTEWALPTARQLSRQQLLKGFEGKPVQEQIKNNLRGGIWRNFASKYPEVREMQARMIEVSDHIAAAAGNPSIENAILELYRGQCNCPYWHGAFGGLYLPHLRHAIYKHLISADNACLADDIAHGQRVDIELHDFNLDGRRELRISTALYTAYFCPHQGGMLYELDIRPVKVNLLATLSRRPEPYHETIKQIASQQVVKSAVNPEKAAEFKQPDLEKHLIYDKYPRKSLIDHCYPLDTTLEDVVAGREKELGDFVQGAYIRRLIDRDTHQRLRLFRQGHVRGQSMQVSKEIVASATANTLTVRYRLDELPPEPDFYFAVEMNFAGFPANQDDRYYYHAGKKNAGQTQTLIDIKGVDHLGIVDEFLGLDCKLQCSSPAGIWAFPIQTVSQSEGGFELVHQGVTMIAYFVPQPDKGKHWEVEVVLKMDAHRRKSS
ncbi:MAG: alpha-amylase/4-alpha-glucanotransferase domain-containing protein [Gemmatales bacterium]